MPHDPDTYVCASCGETHRYGDHDLAAAEMARNNYDPADCVVVCDACFEALRDLDEDAILVGPTLN